MSQDLLAPGRLRVGINVQDNENPKFRMAAESDTEGDFFLEQYSADAACATVNFRKSRGTVAAPANVAQQDRVVDILGSGYASGFLTMGNIRQFVDDTVTNGQAPASRWDFAANAKNASAVIALTIDRDAQVAIGFTNYSGGSRASERFSVQVTGANALRWGAQLINPDNTNNDLTGIGILFTTDSNNALAKGGIAYFRSTADWGRGRFQIFQNPDATATKPTVADTVVQIENSGRFGICSRGAFSATVTPLGRLTILEDGVAAIPFVMQTYTQAPTWYTRAAGGTLAAPTAVASGSWLARIEANAWTGAGSWNFAGILQNVADANAVSGQSIANRWEFHTNDTNQAPSLRQVIKADGKIAMGPSGWATPAGDLDLASQTTTLQFHVYHAISNTTGGEIQFRKARTGLSAPTDAADQDFIGRLTAYPRSTTFQEGASIRFKVEGTFTAGQRPPTSIEFYTNVANTAPVQNMVLDTDGNLGLSAGLFSSTERPAANIHVLGEGAPDLHVHIEKAAGAGVAPGLMEFFRSRGTVAARTNVADTDVLGRISSHGYATSYQEAAYQQFTVDGAVVAGQIPPSRIDFFTGIVNVAASRQISIRANGNINAGPVTEMALTAFSQLDGHVFSSEATAKHLWLSRGNDSNGANLLFSRARTSMSAPSNVVDGDRIVRVEGHAYSGATGYWAGARIDTYVDGAVVDNQRPGTRIVFFTNAANTAVAERMRITAAGKVGIGVTPDSDKLLHIEISQTATSFFKFRNTANASNAHAGMIQAGSNTTGGSDFLAFFRPDGTYIGAIQQNAATTVQYLTSSDRRLKENIVDAPPSLTRLNAIKVREYSWKGMAERTMGFIAQELHEVYPEAVFVGHGEACGCNVGGKDADGLDVHNHKEGCCHRRPWGIDYGRLTPLLVKAIQELHALVTTK
jgi:hypothetical protein